MQPTILSYKPFLRRACDNDIQRNKAAIETSQRAGLVVNQCL